MKKSNTIVSIGLIASFILSTCVANAGTVRGAATMIKGDSPPSRIEMLKEKMKNNREKLRNKKPGSEKAMIDPSFKKNDEANALLSKMRDTRKNRKAAIVTSQNTGIRDSLSK